MPKPKVPPPASAPTKAANRPVHEIKHRRIRAAIWQNQSGKGPMYSVTITRMYKDKEGKWRDSNSFGFDELLTAAKALTDAHTLISQAMNREHAARRDLEPKRENVQPREQAKAS